MLSSQACGNYGNIMWIREEGGKVGIRESEAKAAMGLPTPHMGRGQAFKSHFHGHGKNWLGIDGTSTQLASLIIGKARFQLRY